MPMKIVCELNVFDEIKRKEKLFKDHRIEKINEK